MIGLVLAGGLLVSSFILGPAKANALSGSEFKAGRIVEDYILYDGTSMSAGDIQSFLNAKVPTCDTNGTGASTHWYSGGNRYYTRAEWGNMNGNPAPYTCLKNYTENTPTKVADAYCSGTYTGGNKSAAQIIRDVGVACSLSPKSMLVLLQKEQSLVTDVWPWSAQYRSATGYGCPDTAACDSQYYGFFNQVYNAARQLNRYAKQPQNYNYRAGRTSFIQYNPNSGCGGTNVYIENNATAALYNYTPYQPNAAALGNLYGSGDSCSAYGNRNFWRLFSDWFDFNPSSMIINGVTMTNIAIPDTSPARGQEVTYTISFKNNLSASLSFNAVGIVGRLGSVDGANRDFDWQGPFTLAAGETKQFSFTKVITDTGRIYAWPSLNYQGSYAHYNNWGTMMDAHTPRLTVISGLESSSPNPVAGETATLSATVRNDEDQPLDIESIGIPVRYVNTYRYDTAWSTPATLQPGATKDVSGTITFDKTGQYTAWLSSLIGGMYTSHTGNLNLNASKLSPNFTFTNTEAPNPVPAVGEEVAYKFKLKNNLGVGITLDAVGVVGRYDNPYTGANRDFGWVGPVTFSAGEEKTFTSFVSNVSETKNFYSWVATTYQGAYTHYNNWGFMMKPHLPNLTFSSPLTINSGSQPTLGQTVSVTATIKNNEPKPIRYNAIGIPARYYNAYNYDATWEGSGTLAASGQSGDTNGLSGTITFDKRGLYTVWSSININGNYITIGNPQNLTF